MGATIFQAIAVKELIAENINLDGSPATFSGNIIATGFVTGKKVGIYASLDSATTTTITTAATYYPILGDFTNSPIENFSGAVTYTPGIKYDGAMTQYFEIDWHATISADGANTTICGGVKKNGVLDVRSVMHQFCKNAAQLYNLSGTFVVELAEDDEIQLVTTSDGNGDVLTFDKFTTTITEFFD